MDREHLYELLRLLYKLHDQPRLYCPLKDNIGKVSNQILRHEEEILKEV